MAQSGTVNSSLTFECETSRLGIANMMSVGWGATADHAWLLCNKAQVFFGANALGPS